MHIDEITVRENNRAAMVAATRKIVNHIAAGRIETTRIEISNSGECAIRLGWGGSFTRSTQRTYEQVRKLFPNGTEKLQYRSRKPSKRAADRWQYTVDLDGCELHVDFLKPHEHEHPRWGEGVWRCGHCGARLSKKAVRELGVEGPVL